MPSSNLRNLASIRVSVIPTFRMVFRLIHARLVHDNVNKNRSHARSRMALARPRPVPVYERYDPTVVVPQVNGSELPLPPGPLLVGSQLSLTKWVPPWL
jgi:hypothetical protein